MKTVKNNKKNKERRNIGFLHSDEIKKVSKMEQPELLNHFKINKFGLDYAQAEEKIKKHGDNISKRKTFNPFLKILRILFNPFNLVLIGIAIYNVISYFFINVDDNFSLIGAGIIAVMIIISGSISFIQDFRSYLVLKKLTETVSNRVTILRLTENEKVNSVTDENYIKILKEAKDIESHQLVKGDLIHISSGDMLPADVRILWSNELFINQSSLTGESMPVEKHAKYNPEKENLLELENVCFTGTNVISGSAIAICVGVGSRTYNSAIQASISNNKSLNNFDQGIKKITRLIIMFMLVMAPLVFIINGITNNDWVSALLFAIAVAVGLTPEMFPLIINTNLMRGAKVMSKEKVVVKKLNAIQSLGAIDILCTDKTGTLTNDNIELVNYFTLDNSQDAKLMQYFYLNSLYQTGLKNPIDKAIINYVDKNRHGITTDNFIKVDEIPFDFNRRRLTVVFNYKDRDNDQDLLISKGAVEEVISACKYIYYQGKVVEINDSHIRMLMAQNEKLNKEGLRLIALAYKKVDNENDYYSVKDEKDLIFYGFSSFLDKPKSSAKRIIKALDKYGVSLKILTGDNAEITKAICSRVDLKITGIISGPELERLSEFELSKVVEKNNVFVKLNPLQKTMIIEALQQNQHVVGFMGDGINDAPVLKQSDVAISVDNATDIAKEASDIILLQKSLLVLERGVVEGRRIFSNILKYINITISSAFGNVLSILIASAWLPFEPVSPIQILTLILLYDFMQLFIAFDPVDEQYLKKPKKWNVSHILPFTLILGPISTIFDILSFVIFIYVFDTLGDNNNPQLFQTGWFILSLFAQTLVVLAFRSASLNPFKKGMKIPYQWLLTIIVGLAIGLSLPFTPIGGGLNLVKPPLAMLGYIALLIVGYVIFSQIGKYLYIKIFKRWY